MRRLDLLSAQQTRRVVSIDALRGLNIFCVIGLDGIMWAIAEMSQGKGTVVSVTGTFIGDQFTHVHWEGLRFYDFIFPLFIFITGVSIVFSLPQLAAREGKTKAHLRVLRRSLLLYVLGFIAYGGFTTNWADVRVLGVLQRIGLCYFFTSLMFLNLNLRGLLAALVVLLVGYWALMTFIPVPGIGTGSFVPDANLANWIDYNYLPGRLWEVTRDPEGMLSTLPAVGTCLLGVFAGILLRNDRLSEKQKTIWLITFGCALIVFGYLWAVVFPIIKEIWTSSFALVTAGYSAVLLAAMHQIIDVWRSQRWATVFIWIGANAIALYFINEVFGFEPFVAHLVGGEFANSIDNAVTQGAGGLVTNLLGLVLAVGLAGFLYQRKIFLRV
jgi:predicted acyltransferase